MSLLAKFITLVTGGTTTSKEPLRSPQNGLKHKSTNSYGIPHDADPFEVFANDLRQHLAELDESGGLPPDLKIIGVEKRIKYLQNECQNHPLLSIARERLAAFRLQNPSRKMEKPVFSAIGTTKAECPTCGVALEKLPSRKSKCKHCEAVYFVKTRPLDEVRVLLRESEIEELERQWRMDFEYKQAQTKPLSPKWQKIFDDALTSGPHPDPKVEAEAIRVFKEDRIDNEWLDAKVARLLPHASKEFQIEVERRVWQLQTKSMHIPQQ